MRTGYEHALSTIHGGPARARLAVWSIEPFAKARQSGAEPTCSYSVAPFRLKPPAWRFKDARVIRAVITGAAGRMGSALVRAVQADAGFALVGVTARAGAPGLTVPVFGRLEEALAAVASDVVIDFTSAPASVEHARLCSERGVRAVIGSTGFSAEQRAEIERYARSVPIVLAPNTSVGANLLVRLAGEVARILGEEFDVEILEVHHRRKKDAPSGTALRIAEEVTRALGRSSADVVRARVGERSHREIGVQALRGGDVVGDHTVFFLGDGERLELVHRASSREQFARGALRAAKWLVGRSPGLYGMEHVLWAGPGGVGG